MYAVKSHTFSKTTLEKKTTQSKVFLCLLLHINNELDWTC